MQNLSDDLVAMTREIKAEVRNFTAVIDEYQATRARIDDFIEENKALRDEAKRKIDVLENLRAVHASAGMNLISGVKVANDETVIEVGEPPADTEPEPEPEPEPVDPPDNV